MTDIFTVLCIDQDGKSDIEDIDSMAKAIAYPTKIWGCSPSIKDKHVFSDNLQCEIRKLKSAVNMSFEMDFSGNFDYICDIRLPIVEHLVNRINFNRVFVIRDDASKDLAEKIYPLLNETENALRGYIIRFFAVKYGADWFERTIDENAKKKTKDVSMKGDIENVVQNKIYNMHFKDLYSFIGDFCTGYQTRGQVIEKLLRISSEEELKLLQKEVQENGQKYFKDTFMKSGFESKWKGLIDIRNSVAHNKIIDKCDVEEAKKNIADILSIINDAMDKLDSVVVAEDDVLKTAENVEDAELKEVAGKISHPCGLTEDIVIKELLISQKKGKYTGLRSFVYNILDKKKGFPYYASFQVINKMIDQKKIEIYQEQEKDYTVAAIRIPKQ